MILNMTGKGSGGDSVDIPTFDIAWDSSYTTTTITCDETFSECWNRYYGGVDMGAYVHIHGTDDGWEDNRVAVPVNGVGNDYIAYVVSGTYGPEFDIMYYANGTINRVEPSAYSTTLTATANGEYWPTRGVYSNVIVNVSGGGSPTLQNKTVNPSESQQTIQADSGYDGLGTVTVNGIPFDYVGSGIDQLDSSDLTVSGATVTAPAGYYSTSASQSVSSMTLPTSAASSATSGYTSKATIGRSTAAQYINIPPGYNSTGAYYVISAVANGSATAPSTISGTAASVSTGTNTLTLTKTVSVTPTVTAGYVSSGTAGNASVSLTASVTTKAAATITPTTTNQTIAAGTYLTGIQTIAGDADLVGSNILSTANIFGVQGTVVVQNYYTGSSTPSSSLGSNGDLYLQV